MKAEHDFSRRRLQRGALPRDTPCTAESPLIERKYIGNGVDLRSIVHGARRRSEALGAFVAHIGLGRLHRAQVRCGLHSFGFERHVLVCGFDARL